MGRWSSTPAELVTAQQALAREAPGPWAPRPGLRVGGCFVCWPRGAAGAGSAHDRGWAAAAVDGEVAVVEGEAGAPYEPGLLALREGPLLERAVRALAALPDVLLVGCWLRTRRGARPLAVHVAWRTDAGTAMAVVLGATRDARTPEPLRAARGAARRARAAAACRD